jgi:hypothetical protein
LRFSPLEHRFVRRERIFWWCLHQWARIQSLSSKRRQSRTVQHVLLQASLQKVTPAGGVGTSKHPGILPDKHTRGEKTTKMYANLLRYGAVHFEQIEWRKKYKKASSSEHIIQFYKVGGGKVVSVSGGLLL